MRFLTTLMTAAVVLANSPVLAAGTATTAQPKPAMAAKAAAAAPSPNTKYCIDPDATGTRIHLRQCKTRAEWAKAGVDIDQAQDR
jgi:hypothetical protein